MVLVFPMTTRNQPHKYRCETCKFNVKSINRTGFRKCEKSNYLLDQSDVIGHISKVGCASHSSATKAEQHGRLKCPKCNGPVFIANIDDEDTILCYDDTCKWKQKIVAEPDITLSAVVGFEAGQKEAEQRIADVIPLLESMKNNSPHLNISVLGKAIALLRGKEE